MSSKVSTYWVYQFFGWGLFILINLFFALAIQKFDLIFIQRLLIFVILGFSFSHLMRFSIIRTNLLNKPVRRQLITVILLTLVCAFAVGSLDTLLIRVFAIRTWQEKSSAEWKGVIANTFPSFVYLFVWNCIYFSYHYIQTSRKQKLEMLKLQALVKELEQNTARG
jgi:two-component system, LytTR family, sensor kinase